MSCSCSSSCSSIQHLTSPAHIYSTPTQLITTYNGIIVFGEKLNIKMQSVNIYIIKLRDNTERETLAIIASEVNKYSKALSSTAVAAARVVTISKHYITINNNLLYYTQ